MGGDAQLDNVTKTINAGGFDKAIVANRPQILARPLGIISKIIDTLTFDEREVYNRQHS